MLTVLDCRWADLEHCVGGGDAQPVAARNLRADLRLQPALARTADDAAAGLVPAWHSTGLSQRATGNDTKVAHFCVFDWRQVYGNLVAASPTAWIPWGS